jgi:hypothetical protein
LLTNSRHKKTRAEILSGFFRISKINYFAALGAAASGEAAGAAALGAAASSAATSVEAAFFASLDLELVASAAFVVVSAEKLFYS